MDLFEGAAVVALGLGLVAEEVAETVAAAGEALETFGEAVVTVLGAGDLEVAAEFLVDGAEGAVGVVEGGTEGGGEEAGFEAGGAEDGDGLLVFDADDGEVGGGEAMAAGVLGGAGLAGGSAGSSGARGVGAVGGELLCADRWGGVWHADSPLVRGVARAGAWVRNAAGLSGGKAGDHFSGRSVNGPERE